MGIGVVKRRWCFKAGTDGYRQIGFLTEWQLYAQKLEGDNWTGDKLDEAKLNKMSGMVVRSIPSSFGFANLESL